MRLNRVFLTFFFLHVSLCASDLHVKLLEPFLGIKYRNDGTTNINEEYTLFANTSKIYKKAGLNCSGFVLTAMKQLLGKNITIAEAKIDTNQNSGVNSPMGQDWDFGRDLIQNIAKDYSYEYISKRDINPNSLTGDGIDIYDLKAWKFVFEKIKKNRIYLLAFSKNSTLKGYKTIYHHVGIIIKDSNRNIWLYHATQKNGVHRVWLNYDRNMRPFAKEFKKDINKNRKVLILEVSP